MHTRFFRWLGLGVLATFVSVLAIGCAQSRDPINRVQAGALDKHFFAGANLSDPTDDPEFYMGTRIIDEPYGVGQGFFMFQSVGALARLKWEIQENLLIGRLTYERIQNSDFHGSQTTNNGQIVAEFAIQSQFDIKRDYNPQTGEQLNIIVENTTDRPWYERDYFRVDWSQNLVTDAYDFDLFAVGGLNGIQYDPGSYYVSDPNDPNAPVFSPDEGYFDVTTKVTARPQVLDTPYGNYPVCDFYGMGTYPAITCDPAEVTVRISFKKVVDDDYEPVDWTGTKMNAFGWFTQDRFGYDRNYGILDQDWHRFAARYNIWQNSHVTGTQCAVDAWRDANGNVQNYKVDTSGGCTGAVAANGTCFVADPNTGLPIPDPNGQPFTKSAVGLDVHRDTDGEGTEDECQFTDPGGNVFNAGSRCDEFTNKCDIPLYARNTKTTPLYYGPGSAPDLFAATAHALNSWNIAVKRAVQLGRVVEAQRAFLPPPQSILTSEADLTADEQAAGGPTVPDIFVLCHNPVIAGDSPACGAPGLAARLGDLRYNVVNIIQTPQLPSAWGIMTDFDDPLTGEKVQGSINEWSYVLDTATQSVEDLIRWINGEISNDQIANGQYLSQWVSASQLGLSQYSPAVLPQQEILSRLASIDKTLANGNGLPGPAQTAAATATSSKTRQLAQNLVQALGISPTQPLPAVIASQLASQNLATALGPSMDAQLESTRQQLLGSTWEGQLMTPNVLQWAGLNPQQPFAGDETTLDMASPLRGLNPMLRKWGNNQIMTGMITKNMCVLEDVPEPDSLVALARQARQLYPLPSTSDPNYAADVIERDQQLHQWIREQFHLSVIAHEMGHSMGLRHNFAGSFDSLNYHTEYWQLRTENGKEKACTNATTPHVNGTDCVGPRWIDPVTDQETNGFIWKWASTTVMDYPGDMTQDMNDIGLYDKAAMRFGYADIVDVEKTFTTSSSNGRDYLQALDGFGGIWGTSLGTPNPRHYSTYNDTYNLLGTCTPRPGWNGDPGDPLAQQCSGANLDYVASRDMKTVDKFSAAVTAIRPDLVANFAVDSQNRVRHPYMFGSDEFADVGNVPVFRFDAGADSYEQMQFLISTYENRYIFNDFRRNQVLFNTAAVAFRTQDRYWDKIQGLTKSLALGIELNSSPAFDPTQSPGFLMPLALGSADGLAMFVRALTRPAPGNYVVTPTGGLGGPPNAWATAWQLGDLGMLTPPSSNVNVALGNGAGRFIQNDYDYTQGYWWSEYQKQVGSYYDKLLAPMYLTEAYNRFISNSEDDYIDGRYKNVSFASIYPNQVRRIFANLMATQSGIHATGSSSNAQIFTLAPYSIPSTAAASTNPLTDVQYLPWDKYDPNNTATTQLQYPPGAVLLDPLVDWEQQYPALINLFWFGPTAFTMDLIDQMRIFSPGDAASLSIPIEQQVRYRDPLTGIEYVAKNYGTEVVNPNIGFEMAKTIGASMIQHANNLAKLSYSVTQPPDPVTGELTYDTDGQGNSIAKTDAQSQALATLLKGYASNIDVVRQLTLFFGYGPLGH
jgi:hypothetical protein